jgi:predicted enzyme related to lactoylglutathione lyase
LKYSVSIDVPTLADGLSFYGEAFGFVESARPVEGYAVLICGDAEIGLIEKAAGTHPAKGSSDIRRYERHWTPVHIDFYVDDFDNVLANALDAGAQCEQKFDGGEHPPAAFCSDPFGNGFCIIGKKSDSS